MLTAKIINYFTIPLMHNKNVMKCVYNIYLIAILPADACDDDDGC